MSIHILKYFYGKVFHFLPRICRLFIFLIEEMQLGPVRNLRSIMRVIRVCSPGKINYVLRDEIPRYVIRTFGYRSALFLITKPNLIGVLQFPGATNHKVGVDRDAHVEVTPNTMKLSSCKIWISMPALIIILCHLWIPLGH